MRFLPNTYVDVYRETNTLDPDEDTDSDVAIILHQPVSIIEQQWSSSLSTSQNSRTLRTAVGRIRGVIEIKRNDRFRDLKTNKMWTVEEVLTNGNPLLRMDTRLMLSRTN